MNTFKHPLRCFSSKNSKKLPLGIFPIPLAPFQFTCYKGLPGFLKSIFTKTFMKIFKAAPYKILPALLILYATSLYSYLLFHAIVEMFSIIIACGIFMIAWNSRRFAQNGYLLFLGIAYLFVGFDDLLHTLAYKGMGVFSEHDANLPTQLWMIARYTESISLLIAPVFISKVKLNSTRTLLVYSIITLALLIAVFRIPVFPNCYVEGYGLTLFKRISEMVICLILAGAALHLMRYRHEFNPVILRLLLLSILLTIGAEFSFIFYVGVYDISNLLGHLFKFLSFYTLYVAMIQTSLVKPYDVLFNDLQLEIHKRKQAAQRLSGINADLTGMKQSLEKQLDQALQKKNELTRRLSEHVLKESDQSQAHADALNRLRIAEIENQELRKQLFHYFETLKQSNEDLARIYEE